jgi:hypothetical protein
MRLARKLFLLATMAVAALALSASAATAQVHIEQEHGVSDNEPCPALTGPPNVTGGCHLEIRSERHLPLVLQTAGGPVTLSNCRVHLEGRVGEDGVGWVTRMTFTPEIPPTNPSCTRAPCDSAAGVVTPWPVAITEAAGVGTVETTFCLRTIASGPGGAGTSCEVHLPWNDNGSHQYEYGVSATYSCENLPPVSIQNVHFINEGGTPKEDIEIVH